ncbi:hypothetical protein RRG08_022715 [Elysia crispata]|uniref:Uncharacterized protein n=1 Tax=Elysia crispata TaxID=231223 RepID=A0AAE0ZF93_9GAST|nr:hypothetical protein RRG08_022715 [Elysia crispata]
MKPDSPVDERVNADDNSLMSPSMMDNDQEGSTENSENLDFDMDDEVMTFMHSNIHRQLMKFTKKSAWGIGKKRKMMADDTKAYFQEVIRGAGLFGILTRSGSEDSKDGRGAEGFMDNFEDDSWADLPEPRLKKSGYVLSNCRAHESDGGFQDIMRDGSSV